MWVRPENMVEAIQPSQSCECLGKLPTLQSGSAGWANIFCNWAHDRPASCCWAMEVCADVPAFFVDWGCGGRGRGEVLRGARYRATLTCQGSYLPAKFCWREGRMIYDWLYAGRTQRHSRLNVAYGP